MIKKICAIVLALVFCLSLLGAVIFMVGLAKMGDGGGVSYTVHLSFPSDGGETNQVVKVEDPEVREALGIVEDVMKINRFKRGTGELHEVDKEQGLIASYGGICGVGFKEGTLYVGFFEKRSTKFSPDIQKAMDEVLSKFRGRYGALRVKVEKN